MINSSFQKECPGFLSRTELIHEHGVERSRYVQENRWEFNARGVSEQPLKNSSYFSITKGVQLKLKRKQRINSLSLCTKTGHCVNRNVRRSSQICNKSKLFNQDFGNVYIIIRDAND